MKKRIFALAILAALAVGVGNRAQADALVVSVIVGTFTDGGPAWQTALGNAGVPADLYYDPQNPANGWPDLTPYDAVVVVYNDVWWTTAQGAFGPADEAVMAGYGGILVIIGQDYIWSTGGGAGPSAWLMSRFNITSVIEDVNYGDVDLMTLTGSVGGPFDGLIDSGMPCWVDNGWFTDDVTHSGIPTQDWVSPLGSGHGGCFVADGLFSTNAYECFDNFQLWVDAIAAYFGLVGGQCPADINGDGVVDVLDLLEVLGQWGAAGGPADINGDGIVDVLDLLEVLAGWGPCNPIGACCIWPGPTCQDLTQVDCTMAGGYDWAEGEECATYQCPDPPLGACCFYPSGDCQDLNAYDCAAAGGNWEGAGTDCATTTCPAPPPGDVIETAIPVPLPLPYSTSGDTSVGYNHDYDEVCPYTGSLSNDVVYAYTADFTGTITIDLCGMTAYDSKLYVYDNPTPVTYYACNDDFCVSGAGQSFVSQLANMAVTNGTTYYIVIDGYGSQNGFYTLDITTP